MIIDDILRKLEDQEFRIALNDLFIFAAYGRITPIVKEVRYVDPKRILYIVWDPLRLQNALRLFKQGKEPPPSLLTSVIWLGEEFFTVTDGNHRAAACVELGINRIKAEIRSRIEFGPDDIRRLVVYQNGLWMRKDEDSYLLLRYFRRPQEGEIAGEIGIMYM